MPEFSLRLPRFWRSRRSRSPKPSPAGSRNDVATSLAPYLGPSAALSSHPSSIHGTPQQVDDTTMGCLRISGQPPHISQSITPIHVDNTISGSKRTLQDSVAPLPNPADTIQSSHLSYSFATPSQQSPALELQRAPAGENLSPPHYQQQGMFHQAHNLSATGNFIDGNVGHLSVTNVSNSNNFMKELLKETIPGAAADSSARDPPPRCHPGTRLAILERCLYFIAHCNGAKKMRWVVGAAGVGKSAVMQNVAESPELEVAYSASVFFSVNGRSDGTKAIMTFSYQFAAKSKVYRNVIEGQVTDDPRLLQSSMTIQFENFIIQPFIHNPNLHAAGRVLIIIDGLDECNDTRTQVELLRLISNFCASHPSSPLVWLIASRPEPHITSFFSRPEVAPVHEKEEIPVDSDEARADVERVLRYQLTEIGKASGFLGPQWPDEQHLWKLANAAGGLFAYAQTVIRYIGDTDACDPVSQLSDVLNVIDKLPMGDIPQEQHPMALLDALYSRILSKVPPKIMINARKILLFLASDWDQALDPQHKNFIVMCNWLRMTADEAYAALNRLRSILDFPPRHEAHKKSLKPFHKSFIDYLFRSGFSTDIKLEAQKIKTQCAFRVLKETPSGVAFSHVGYSCYYGDLARNGGTGDQISIIWQTDEGDRRNDDRTRLSMYKLAIGEVAAGMKRGDITFQTETCIRLLTTRFYAVTINHFPFRELCDVVIDKSRCHEFMKNGILKQIPAKATPISNISQYLDFKLQFYCPVVTMTLPNPWNSSCEHEQRGQWEQGKEQNWTTTFGLDDCAFCVERFQRQVKHLINRHPEHQVSIMFTSGAHCCVQVQFVDPEDDVSEWTYWFWVLLFRAERKELGSTI